jgi:hypothetical protein
LFKVINSLLRLLQKTGTLYLGDNVFSGNKVVATGATSGLGFETALELANRGIITFHYTKFV